MVLKLKWNLEPLKSEKTVVNGCNYYSKGLMKGAKFVLSGLVLYNVFSYEYTHF